MNKTALTLLPLLILIAAVIIAVSMRGLSEAPQKSRSSGNNAQVEYITAQPGRITFTIESRGVVKPLRQSNISTDVNGMVTRAWPALASGRFVTQGDKLLQIDPTDYQLAVDNAEANRLQARLDLEDKQAQFNADTLIVEQARAAQKAADKAVQKARADLADTTVKAPFSGIISNRQLETGQYAQTGTMVATLAGTDTAEIRLPVTSGHIRLIAPALFRQPAIDTRITLTAEIGGQLHRRTVQGARLEGGLDPVARSYYLNVELPDPYGLQQQSAPLPHGTFVEAAIEAQPLENAFRLPLSVVHDKNHVYLLHGNKLKKQPVSIAYQQASHAIITGGITAGDKIVTSRLDIMFDGMTVDAVQGHD